MNPDLRKQALLSWIYDIAQLNVDNDTRLVLIDKLVMAVGNSLDADLAHYYQKKLVVQATALQKQLDQTTATQTTLAQSSVMQQKAVPSATASP